VLSISWRELQRDFFPITVLAALGTMIAACVVTGGMVWLLDWPAPSAKELVIPYVADAEEEVADFVAVLARVLAALAMANGPITILEYTCCVKTVSPNGSLITLTPPASLAPAVPLYAGQDFVEVLTKFESLVL
jgi:hypothetical protein